MSDQINTKVTDNYREHVWHDSYDSQCSLCYKENRLLKSWQVVNRKKILEELGTPIGYERRKFDDPSWTNNPLE